MINAKRDDNRIPALLGHSATGPSGVAQPVLADNQGRLYTRTIIDDGQNLDAFSRSRVSSPDGIFDSTFQYDMQPLLFYRTGASGATATFSANTDSTTLTLDGTAGGYMRVQSKTYHRYIPGKSQMILMTQVVGSASAGVVKRFGYFDANDGIFVEQNGTTDLAIVRRTSTSGSPVDNRVVQASWNIDPLNGSGNSGITLDISKASILVIDLQWLGMGRVRVGFDIDGDIVYAHEFLNANNLSVPYMKTANLPTRWEISGSATGSMNANCCSVISEGGTEADRGIPFNYANVTGANAATGTRSPVISIQPATTFNSQTNRISTILNEYVAMVTSSNPILIELVYNTTITGGTWNAVDTNSSMNYNNTVTATGVTGGFLIDSTYLPASNQVRSGGVSHFPLSRLPITLDPAGANPISVTLYATGLGGNATAYAGIGWVELR